MHPRGVPILLPHLWKSALISGILALALGIVVSVWPGISILVAAIVFGAYLLISGIAQVFFAFSLQVSAGGRVLLFISGAASLVLALLCFRSLANSVLLLAIWIGVGFIFRGVATSVSAIGEPALPGRGWTIFLGVISLLAGIVMLAAPFASLEILTLVVGIWLVVIGVFEVVSAFGMRAAFKAITRAVPGTASQESQEASP
ncbi:HdeD family acid-resistance protein [Mycobacterium sp. SM1]|uniref:HdeD family acid-resistance protein n=1 Tax=Mycobacterium sp. SM1 TaxID=2816243 RepID=UPI001BD11C7B|nr:HdeD family acid-resistance protein [Mycobacterium sp. SM1]MBS4729625.1 HdeD family acid-resistance protein [Mycobacterium sp. SM1]